MKRRDVIIWCLVCLILAACSRSIAREIDDGVPSGDTALHLVASADSLGIDEECDVEIRLERAVNLYGLHIHLEFDPAKMQVVDADPEREGIQITPGHLPSPDFIALNMVDNEYGMIDYAVVQTYPREPASGSGIVAVIRVRAIGPGISPIAVLHAQLSDPDGNELPVRVENFEIDVR